MATKSRPKRRKTARRQKPPTITMLHVFNALGQIEMWIGNVRSVLGNLDARMVLPVPPGDSGAGQLGIVPTMRIGCPPGHPVQKVGCPPSQPPPPRIGCPPPRRRG
jgi:hypothetical protein